MKTKLAIIAAIVAFFVTAGVTGSVLYFKALSDKINKPVVGETAQAEEDKEVLADPCTRAYENSYSAVVVSEPQDEMNNAMACIETRNWKIKNVQWDTGNYIITVDK